MTTFETVSLLDRPDLMDGVYALDELWPKFLLKDLCSRLIDSDLRLLDWVFAVIAPSESGSEVLGRVVTVPLRWETEDDRFPDRGWDAAIVDSVRCFQLNLEPNVMCMLEVTLRPEVRGSGASGQSLRAVKAIARERKLDTVVVPVRPWGKSERLDLTMEEYIDLRDKDGMPIDSWLRLHLREGGRVAGIAPMSMVVTGTFDDWAGWAGVRLDGRGSEVDLPGALVRVSVHEADRVAVYVEPNVWVEHALWS